jgi:F-type H+-transporting ATPase subunit b
MTPGLTANPNELSTLWSFADGSKPAALLVASGGVEIDLDLTFLLQMGLFVFLAVVLKPLLFDPVLRVFALREEKTDGAKADARALQTRAGELLTEYERAFERVHQVAGSERDRFRAETAKLEGAVLEEARRSAAAIVSDGRSQIKQTVNSVRFQLGRESERIAQELSERAMGREVRS